MLNITTGKCKWKPQWDITLYLSKCLLSERHETNKYWQGYGEKGTLMHCWWRCKLIQTLWKTVWRFFKKLKIELPCDPSILVLSIYLKKMKTLIRKDIGTPMFIVALFIIANIWKQPKYPTIDELIKKIWYIYKME